MAKSKQRRKSVKISVVGTSAETVTGSMTLLTYNDITIAIDCGAYQGASKFKTYNVNKTMFKDVSLKKISAICLTHLNYDHQGSICTLFNQGGNPNVYMVEGSYDIARLMYLDSLKIGKSDSSYFEKKFGKEHIPLFTEEDVENALYNTIEIPYNKITKINDFMSIEYLGSGHIYLSAQIIIHIEDGNFKRKIAFSGDLGNVQINKPCVKIFEPVSNCSLFVCEATYAMSENKCTKTHKEKDLVLLSKQIEKTCNMNSGKVLLASFALQRSLDILVDLYKIWEETKFTFSVYLDTPLGIQILQVMERQTKDPIFEKLNNWKNLKYVSDFNETRSILYSAEPSISIVTSGFANGGKILAYFTEILPNKNHCLVTAGFSSEESNMGIVKQRKPIQIMHEGVLSEYPVKCEILELTSYSSHMQHSDLLFYYSTIKTDKLVLNHSENSKKYQFAELLDEELSKKCRTTKIYVLNRGEEIEI